MILETYVQYFPTGEAFFGSDPGWYQVEVTDCDTIISGDYDGSNVVPFATKDDAKRSFVCS